MRNISFFLTTPQFLDGSKDVTRRLGWKNLKVGVHLMAVEKGQGLKKGEKVNRLGEIEVVEFDLEPLFHITYRPDDCRREGFPNLNPWAFVQFFCAHNRCHSGIEVSRIVFKRIAA